MERQRREEGEIERLRDKKRKGERERETERLIEREEREKERETETETETEREKEGMYFQCSRCRAHARSFPKLKLDRGGKINFSRFISPNPSAFVCFRGNRLAAHTLAVIERCECACGSAANATTLAKLSLYHWLV
ncbi:hypothetical protein T4E_8969 [Trichinella pseudospiralis]|uniref:Uncharacterized protein n=1 Tax=Trichinella pseudospiralis TaxID=6337 RepID=A0A0V0YKR9_TRIPS|nr:hypothetical protein T4E_8969 [Trichinella pseudospiralis]